MIPAFQLTVSEALPLALAAEEAVTAGALARESVTIALRRLEEADEANRKFRALLARLVASEPLRVPAPPTFRLPAAPGALDEEILRKLDEEGRSTPGGILASKLGRSPGEVERSLKALQARGLVIGRRGAGWSLAANGGQP